MPWTLDTTEYLDMVCHLLRQGETSVAVPVTGRSMCPFLYPGDTAYLDLPDKKLKKGDIVLFTRPNGQYILHRIVGVREDGGYLLLGDGQLVPEPVMDPSRICARVTSVRRGEKRLAPGSAVWWFFEKPWCRLWRNREAFMKLRNRFRKK